MPRIPTTSSLNANSVGIINAIKNSASMEYYNAVPTAQETTESIRMVGEAICSYQPRMNEFVSALVNRIARVVITSKMYENPWAFAKKGVLDFGETIEEIFVNIAKAYPFNPENGAVDVLKRNKPDVSSMFHAMNLQTFYPVTVSEQQLRQAFTSTNGVTDLISRIVNSLYSAANYDEFIMMKYVIARLALSGALPVVEVTDTTTEANTKATMKAIRSTTNKMGYMSNNYSIAGVLTYVEKNDLYVITTAEFDATADVDVLAYAFNIDRADWAGRHVGVDSFAFNSSELARLNMLLGKDPDYKINPITEADNTALATINVVCMDKDFFQVYDNLNQFTEFYNGASLEWNEFYHVWRIYSASPFANVAMFTSSEPTITNVTVNGPATLAPGSSGIYTASVSGTDFANKGVVWTISDGENASGTVTIDNLGRVYAAENASGQFIVTATSAFDSSKAGNITVAIS